MTARQAIIDYLERVAAALGDDRENVVFVGGSLVGFYASEEDVRMSEDVDLVVAVSMPEYYRLIARLRTRGFRESQVPGAPSCRMFLPGDMPLPVDVMPEDPAVLGFSNRWYRPATAAAERAMLPSGTTIRVITRQCLLATKLDAFRARGGGDFGMSHDLEDIFILLAGAPDLLDTIRSRGEEVSRFLDEELRRLVATPDFLDFVPWHFRGNARGQEQAQALTTRLLAFAAR